MVFSMAVILSSTFANTVKKKKSGAINGAWKQTQNFSSRKMSRF
jgi:hypothetical protein